MATPAQVNQRTRAGSAPKKPRAGSVSEIASDQEPVSDSVMVVDEDELRPVSEIIQGYINKVGEPEGWSDIKILEQVRYEIYKTRLAARDDQKARGQLMAIADVRARDEAKAMIFRRALNGVPDLLAKWVAPDKILAAQAEAREWADETLRRVADEVAG